MKSIIIVVLFLSFLGVACSKKMADEEVTAKVAEALCGKIQECGMPAGLEAGTCSTILKSSLLSPLEKAGKKGKVTEKEMSDCVKDIKAQDCSTFGGPKPPAACSFFKG